MTYNFVRMMRNYWPETIASGALVASGVSGYKAVSENASLLLPATLAITSIFLYGNVFLLRKSRKLYESFRQQITKISDEIKPPSVFLSRMNETIQKMRAGLKEDAQFLEESRQWLRKQPFYQNGLMSVKPKGVPPKHTRDSDIINDGDDEKILRILQRLYS